MRAREVFTLLALAILACACGKPRPRPPAVPPPDAGGPAVATPAPAGGPDRAVCDRPVEAAPRLSFLGAASVVHLRVVAATPGPSWGDRCVRLDLELLDTFHGPARARETFTIVIRQSTVTRYTSRPAGAWWIVEQSLEPGSEYVAFCPTPTTDSLRASCSVVPAADLLADVRMLRDVEAQPLGVAEVAARVRSGCATASHAGATYLWERFAADAIANPAVYDTIVSVLEDPTCARIARGTLLDAVQDLRIAGSAPHVQRLVRAMFRLLAIRAAEDLHDNLLETWLPNTLGFEGAGRKWTAVQVFGADRAGRADAAAALASYRGAVDITQLRGWIE